MSQGPAAVPGSPAQASRASQVAPGPLHGVRVLDLTTVIMGPAATQVLGDLGADVIKVEGPDGDTMRRVGPFKHEGMGPMYLQANRNKRSVQLDLKSADGIAALQALAADVDVLVTNIRPGALGRLGLDYERVRAINPSIIYVSAVGYGSGGPESGQPVYDDLTQAACGISGLFRAIDGAPRYAPINVCDRVVGLYLTIAITSALHHRLKTGEGQDIEVPMFETMAQFVLGDHLGGAAFAPPIGSMGYGRLLSRSRGPYPSADGHIAVVVYTDAHWRAFCRLLGIDDLVANDERFASQQARTQHAEAVGHFLATVLRERTTADWIPALRAIDIPCCRVNAIEDLFEDPHLKAVGLFEQIEHPTEGRLNVTRFPLRFGRSPASIRRLAPNRGEHTAEVLEELAQRRRAREDARADRGSD